MRTRISTAFSWIREHYIWSGFIAVLVLFVALKAFGGNGNGDIETITLAPQEFKRTVAVSGKVIPAKDVELGFEVTGKVSAVYAGVGDRVAAGQTIARLDSGTYASDLKKAEAGVLLKVAESGNEEVNLQKITEEQDTLVASAYKKLLSEGLVAVPQSDYDVSAPLITGAYTGKEGAYKIRVLRKFPGSSDLKMLIFELERAETEIEENQPTALGSHGLFISFPDQLEDYDDTIWNVSIPNTKSSAYLSHYSDYQEALRRREREIAAAEARINGSSQTTVSQYELKQSQAEVSRILAEIEKRVIRAPFAGLITRQDAKVGNIVNANTAVITLISSNAFQIETFVPEINISEVQVGNIAKVALDAYGDEQSFEARVISIDPAETIRDGVSTYRVLFEFTAEDDRLKSGMTANVIITTETKPDALLIPQEAVTKRDGFSYAYVLVGEEKIEKQITTGAVASNGYIEVIAGLSAGEVVVKNAQ